METGSEGVATGSSCLVVVGGVDARLVRRVTICCQVVTKGMKKTSTGEGTEFLGQCFMWDDHGGPLQEGDF